MEGWIKAYRKISDNPLWTLEPFTKGQAWIDLLLIANHKEGQISVRGNIITVKRGQVGWSEVKLAERWKWSRNKVRRYLKHLETEQQIEQQKNSITSIITIVNYELYQGTEQQNGQQTEHQKDSRRNTNNNDKEKEEILTLFNYWIDQKIIKHKKLTDKIKRKINSSLKDYSVNEIKSAIDNYKFILESPLYYFNYKWTLDDFLQRGLDKFIDLEIAKNNYKKETISNNGHKPKEAVTELVI